MLHNFHFIIINLPIKDFKINKTDEIGIFIELITLELLYEKYFIQ